MKKLFIANFSLVLLIASIMFLAGCKPAKPNSAEDKTPLKTDSPVASSPQSDGKIPLKTDLPQPLKIGTPVEVKIPHEPILGKWPAFAVPAGTTNLARGKKVTSSDNDPVVGTLDLVTDGDKAGDDGSWVELGQGKQWVQIDLEKDANIYAIVVWHYHQQQERAYRDVIVQISDDLKFEQGVTTIYDNSTNGKDSPYIETYLGKLMDAKGVKGRYVRLYSSGNTTSKLNHYIEVEVFGKPAA